MRKTIIAAVMLITGFPAAAQVEYMPFDRPEAWALKYFTSVSTFTALGPPVMRKPGSVELGLELGWIPWLDLHERRVGFNGTALEDLNKTRVLARPRLYLGLPGGVTAEVGWVPPVGLNGGRANLISAALERPFVDRPGWSLGLRAYGQIGHGKGDFTCPESAVSHPAGSPENPLGCEERSKDTSTLNMIGGALTGGLKLGDGGAALHYAIGGTYHDVQFQVGALTNGFSDHSLLVTHGWTGWVSAGGGVPVGDRVTLAAELFYSPLIVTRPPSTDWQNDALFTARAVMRFRFR